MGRIMFFSSSMGLNTFLSWNLNARRFSELGTRYYFSNNALMTNVARNSPRTGKTVPSLWQSLTVDAEIWACAQLCYTKSDKLYGNKY